MVETEAKAISKLSHKHIVNIVDYIPKSVYERDDGRKQDIVCVIVNELCTGGELFYYVQNSGPFSETYARYFFH